MRVTIAPQTGQAVPQFIIHAENETDIAILGSFVDYKCHSKRPVTFWMHGYTHSCDRHGVTSFNFGYVNTETFFPNRWQRLKKWLNRIYH